MDIVDDRARVRALWHDAWKVWFPLGKEDPEIILMHLRPESGEYWSTRGTAGIRYLFEAAKALITGERAASGAPEQHAKVRM
jgi:general stress protein 26